MRELDRNYEQMKTLGKRIYEQLQFVEKYSIHRSSPLVQTLQVVKLEVISGRPLKEITDDDVLEAGRIVSLRRQQQLSNFAEQWRATGIDSEKTEIFDMMFENLWDSLNLKRWIDRDNIVWVDEKSENATELVKTLFDTLRWYIFDCRGEASDDPSL